MPTHCSAVGKGACHVLALLGCVVMPRTLVRQRLLPAGMCVAPTDVLVPALLLRFGVIEGLEVGELLGRGGEGRPGLWWLC